jgi:GAF domain-containing protein
VELLVINGVCGGTVFHLPDVPTVLGRSPESHVQVGDPWISSMHALFERRGGEMWVVDLDSRNGTFVNDQRVHEARVGPGMKISFGKTQVELQGRPGAADGGRVVSDQRSTLRYIADFADPSRPAAGERTLSTFTPAPAPRLPPGRLGNAARRQASVLNEIGRALLDAHDRGQALERLLGILAAAVRAERASVLLVDAQGELTPAATLPPGRPPGRSSTLIDATLRARAGILTLNAQEDARFSQSTSVVTQGIQSCISAPIWTDDQILGVLQLERGFAQPFAAEDLELATLAGFQAALAVERSGRVDRAAAAAETRHRLRRIFGPAGTEALLSTLPSDGRLEADLLPLSTRAAAAVIAVEVDGLPALAAGRPAPECAERALTLQRRLSEVAWREGAAVDLRFDGGLLAVLDLAAVQPQAVERAQRCAYALLEAAQSVEAGRPQPHLAIRVGLAFGPALVGNFGPPGQPELRAMGLAVESARRRAMAAAPGRVCDADGAR